MCRPCRYTVATGIISAHNSSICWSGKYLVSDSKSTQAHTCHYKAKNSPILHSCNDVVRGSISHPGESKESTK